MLPNLTYDEFKKALAQFIGTENWYRHSLNRNVTYTDGAKYVADKCGAYWLIDEIATLQNLPKVKSNTIQIWILKVSRQAGVLTCEDGNYNVVYAKKFFFTDFPYPEVTLWFVDNVIMLPSEY